MYQYESIMILTPVLSEDQAKEAVGKFRKILKDEAATIIHEESWGQQPSARVLKMANHLEADATKEGNLGSGKSTGYYHLFEFKCTPNAVKTLELAYKRDERVLRFMTIRLDKFD